MTTESDEAKKSVLETEITPTVLMELGESGRKDMLLRAAMVFEMADVGSPFANWGLVQHLFLTDDEMANLPSEERQKKVCGILRVLGNTTKMDAQEASQSEMRKRGILPGAAAAESTRAPMPGSRAEAKTRLQQKIKSGQHQRKPQLTRGQMQEKQGHIMARLGSLGLNPEILHEPPAGVDPNSRLPVDATNDADDERTKSLQTAFDKLGAAEQLQLMRDLQEVGLVRPA